MKNFTLSVCLMALTLQLYSQSHIGRQLVDQYPITSGGQKTYGLTWLPSDYTTSGATYPLIIFLHSAGETGNGVSGLNNLITQALPKYIADGWNPAALNPSSGQVQEFIVVSPQAPTNSYWSYTYTHVRYILANVLSRYRVDPSRIYLTGASAGGGGVWSSVTNDDNFTKKIAAIVPVSSVALNNPSSEDPKIPNITRKNGVKVWAVCGTSDSRYNTQKNYVSRVNSGTPALPVPAVITGLSGQGHTYTAFNTAYNPSWRSNTFNQNIYEWMLRHSRAGTVSPPPPNQAPVVNAGPDQTLTLPNNSIVINGSASDADGSVSSYNWTKVSGPASFLFQNAGSASTTVSNLEQGSYVFRLTATDNAGATAYDQVTINVNAATPIYNHNVPGKIEAEHYNTMSGIQTENTSDAGSGQNVGWIESNDWMAYSTSVAETGKYIVSFRIASPNSNGQLQLQNEDGSILSTVTIPNTGGYQAWQTIQTAPIDLTAGNAVMRLVAATGGFNINWIEFTSYTASPDPDPEPDPDPIPQPEPSNKFIQVNLHGGTSYNNAAWNNWRISGSANTTSSTFKYSDGSSSTVRAHLSYQVGISDNGNTTTTGMAPQEVLRFSSYSSSSRTLTMSGLTPGKTYRLEIYACRKANSGNSSVFKYGSKTATVSTYNNYTNKAVLDELVPVNGQIAISISQTSTYNYLNGFTLIEKTSTQSAKVINTPLSEIYNLDTCFNIYPNPVKKRLIATVRSSKKGNALILIINNNGLLLCKIQKYLHQGLNTVSLDSGNLKAGNYIVQILVNGKVYTNKFIKIE